MSTKVNADLETRTPPKSLLTMESPPMAIAGAVLEAHEREWWEKYKRLTDPRLPEDVRQSAIDAEVENLASQLVMGRTARHFDDAEILFKMQTLYCIPGCKGKFDDWIKKNKKRIGMDKTSIYNHLNVLKAFGSLNPDIIDQFKWTAMIELSPESCKEAREEAVLEAEKGVRITVTLAKELRAKHNPKPATVPAVEKPSESALPHEEANVGEESKTDKLQLATAERERLEEVKRKQNQKVLDLSHGKLILEVEPGYDLKAFLKEAIEKLRTYGKDLAQDK